MRMGQPLDARWGITTVRVLMGIILIVAGLQKWLGGIGGTIGFFTQVGIPIPELLGPVVAAGEVVGGLLILLGLTARWVALWFTVEFLVTTFVVKLPHQGWDPARLDLMILGGSLMLLLAGAGKMALDEQLTRRRDVTTTPTGATSVTVSR